MRWESCGPTIVAAGDPVPKVMGVVNLTPDSFSDGGRTFHKDDAIRHVLALVDAGADLVDLGGESSRPGAAPVELAEELRRVVPVTEAVAGRIKVPIAIDTTKAEVARQAILAGAGIINDISALAADPEMAGVAAETGAGVVLMHMRGVPATMQSDPRYDDVVAEVYDFLARRVEWAIARGIPLERIAVDPGIGFGKTIAHNLEILRNLDRFAKLGCVVVIGTSRKGFLGAITGRRVGERVVGSLVSSLAAAVSGAMVVRVHDVAAMVDAIKVWQAVCGWEARS
jgi:dihydropteroate synthase